SALALLLSRPAQASLTLRPVRSLTRPNGGPLSPGLRWGGRPSPPPGSYQSVPTPPLGGLAPTVVVFPFSAHPSHLVSPIRRPATGRIVPCSPVSRRRTERGPCGLRP